VLPLGGLYRLARLLFLASAYTASATAFSRQVHGAPSILPSAIIIHWFNIIYHYYSTDVPATTWHCGPFLRPNAAECWNFFNFNPRPGIDDYECTTRGFSIMIPLYSLPRHTFWISAGAPCRTLCIPSAPHCRLAFSTHAFGLLPLSWQPPWLFLCWTPWQVLCWTPWPGHWRHSATRLASSIS
jgi:hypothetical protein